MFVSPAYAQAAAPAPGAGDFSFIIPFILIFVIFYFLIIRPQQKKVREHQAMINAVKRGDEVITSGGIYGKVTKVDDTTVMIEIAKDVRVQVVKGTISDVVRDTPANTNTPAPKQDAANDKQASSGGFLGKLFNRK